MKKPRSKKTIYRARLFNMIIIIKKIKIKKRKKQQKAFVKRTKKKRKEDENKVSRVETITEGELRHVLPV